MVLPLAARGVEMSVGEIVIAGIGALGTIGGGIAFVWDKLEKRFVDIEAKLSECHAREMVGQERRAVQLTVIELLWQQVERLEPGAPVLARAKRLLDELKIKLREDEDET